MANTSAPITTIITDVTSTNLYTTLDSVNDASKSDSESGLSTRMVVTLVYGGCHILLLLTLAFRIYYQTKKEEKSMSLSGYFWALWKDRAVYSPLIIHIYDTATDIGVLYEWYDLALYERDEENIQSIDMEQLYDHFSFSTFATLQTSTNNTPVSGQRLDF